MIIEAIGRRLRLAVIGGGPGSVIGEVHRAGARLDGYYDIVASTLSSDPERSRRYGRAIGVSDERNYPSWRELIESEAKRKNRIDVIAVMTPNDSHYDICSYATLPKVLTDRGGCRLALSLPFGSSSALPTPTLHIRWCAKPELWSAQARSAPSASFIFNMFKDIWPLRMCLPDGDLIQGGLAAR